ncbi:MAG: hypothetical protein M0R03_02535 [Novosphingobium sp.]|nr:hypothetical protein [Novosphingobium sp.]
MGVTENLASTVGVQIINPTGFFVQPDRAGREAAITRDDQRRKSCVFRYALSSKIAPDEKSDPRKSWKQAKAKKKK